MAAATARETYKSALDLQELMGRVSDGTYDGLAALFQEFVDKFHISTGHAHDGSTEEEGPVVPAANSSLADAGSLITATTIEAALQEAFQHIKSAQAFLPIHLAMLREVASDEIAQSYDTQVVDIPLAILRESDATNILNEAASYGLLGSNSTPILDYTNGDTDSNLRLSWAASNSDPIVAKIDLEDIDTSSDITVTVRAAMAGTTDTPVIDLDSYFDEGDTKVSDATGSVTGTAVTEYTATIANGDIPAGARTLTIEFTPGAHTTDILYVYQIRLSYTAATENNAQGVLGKSTTPILEMTNGDTDSAFRVNWAASNSDPVIFQTPLPPDLDVSADVVIHLRAAMAGATDTPTIASDAYVNEGDTKVEDVSAAITGTSYAEYTITIAATDVPTGAQTLTVELTPGAHTTDALYITSCWIEYTRSTLTA